MSKSLVLRIQERVDVLCRRHPLGFRIVTSGVLFAGGIATQLLVVLDGFAKLLGLIPFALAGSAALVRESTGYRHAMGKTQGARKEVVYKMLEFTALSLQAQAAAEHASPSAKLIRANVMIPSADGGTLKIWVHYNMAGDPDCELEIDAHTGFAGYCMRYADGPVAYDRRKRRMIHGRCCVLRRRRRRSGPR